MNQGKVLMKVGGRKHLGEMRWKGALDLYSKIYCVCLFKEKSWPIDDERVEFIEMPRNFFNEYILKVLERTKKVKCLAWLNWLIIFAVRFMNRNWLEQISKINANEALCSYGDYDFSDLVYILAKPAIRIPVTRAYKESRPEYNFLEYHSMRSFNRFVFYHEELVHFLKKKYGEHFFDGKDIKCGLDENALPRCILNNIDYQPKLSASDGKVHLALLTFRIDSAPNRARDQGRYYYLDMIQQLLDAGVVVHLHCAQFNNYKGVNRYQELAEKKKGQFIIEDALDMKHNTSCEGWVKSCEVLSRYDAGILHNIQNESSVSEFDRINVPHRFFAYEAAHVTPVIERGNNVVLEKIFAKKKCGFVYDSFQDLPKLLTTEIKYFTPSYEDYLKEVFC